MQDGGKAYVPTLWAGTRMNKSFLKEGNAALPSQSPHRDTADVTDVYVQLYTSMLEKAVEEVPAITCTLQRFNLLNFSQFPPWISLRLRRKQRGIYISGQCHQRVTKTLWDILSHVQPSTSVVICLLSLMETCPGWSVLCYSFNFLVFYLFPLPLKSCSEVPLLPAGQGRLWEQIVILD